MPRKLKGPFGRWGFPILNRLIEMFSKEEESLEEKLKREGFSNGGNNDEFEKTFEVVRDSNGEVERVKVSKEKK